ncbi:hypothetical protein LCGC14_1344220 [marine sediment metagenome]|uniref:Uncharacterized protein n=1 Tax=marine sediment metagenome TaxID=412755 RepID=A0A0F9KZ05_9ZZZZ
MEPGPKNYLKAQVRNMVEDLDKDLIICRVLICMGLICRGLIYQAHL